MIERAYTVSEIRRMREAVEYGISPGGGTYYPAERAMRIEEQLRTCMMAGVDPEEVVKDAYERVERFFKVKKAMDAERQKAGE